MEIIDIHIRPERHEDYHETELLTREAFWNCYAPGAAEHYLLHIMRESPNFVRELDFVATTCDGKIIGSVVFMKSFIAGDDGNRHDVLTMGPLSVHPSFQRKGIGRQLIDHARRAAQAAHFRAIMLCGDPKYYSKVGFTAAERFGIRTAENKYFAALHACALHADALKDAAGRYYEDEIYMVDETASLEFDKQFPYKTPIAGTPTQLRFNEVIAMQREYDG